MSAPSSATGGSAPAGSTSLHVRVTGRVQGVGYRAFVCATARALGIVGWVCNRPDGSVQVAGQGLPSSIQALADALWRGPPGARVASVEPLSAATLDHAIGFEVHNLPAARSKTRE